MKRQLLPAHAIGRAAFTITELIVTVFIVLLLLSLLLPAVRTAREPARRLQCMNHVRSLAMATINRATSQGGKVPFLSEPSPGLASDIQVGWPIHLMPYLDRSDVVEYLMQIKTKSEARVGLGAVLSGSMSMLQCPDDSKHFRQPGGISFGANIGYGAWRGTPDGIVAHYDFGATDHSVAAIDWDRNGNLDATDREVARATGAFWFADENSPRLTFDDIVKGDGTGSTILFAETTNLPLMHQAGAKKNGENPRALDLGIGIGYESLRLFRSSKPSLYVDRKAKASPEYSLYFRPNSNQGKGTGKWPVASSHHPKGFNVAFADGHASSISNDIHWSVWASLHTPQGMKYEELNVSDADY